MQEKNVDGNSGGKTLTEKWKYFKSCFPERFTPLVIPVVAA
jgi:hypothetical protein